MAQVRITVRMFIEAAIQFSRQGCETCELPLELVWIGDEASPDLFYIHCPKCQREYSLTVLFIPDTAQYKE